MGSNFGVASYSRPDRLTSNITMANTNTEYQLPSTGGLIDNANWIRSMHLRVKCRLTNPAANGPTAVLADAPYSLIDEVRIEGTYRPTNQAEVIVKLRGADLRIMAQQYMQATLQSLPAVILTAANATNDIDFIIPISFAPLGIHPTLGAPWALDAPMYDNLRLYIVWADDRSVFTPGAAASTFSAYGSGGGSPTITVTLERYMQGQNFGSLAPGKIRRYYKEVKGAGVMTSTASAQRIVDVPRGNRMRSIWLKTGVQSTNVTAGRTAFLSLSNTVFANLFLQYGNNRQIRNPEDFIAMQQFFAIHRQLPVTPTVGYAPMDFCDDGMPDTSLDLRGKASGATGDVDIAIFSDVVGAANQACVAIFEEWVGFPHNR